MQQQLPPFSLFLSVTHVHNGIPHLLGVTGKNKKEKKYPGV
jgi:hypothetical protein